MTRRSDVLLWHQILQNVASKAVIALTCEINIFNLPTQPAVASILGKRPISVTNVTSSYTFGNDLSSIEATQ